jgi:UDPglucose 6-dehydrogenase
MDKPKVGIIGVGWVGTPLKRYLEEFRGYKLGENLLTYDILPEKCAGDINDAEIIFIALPTPRNPEDGTCDTSIIEGAIPKIKGDKIIVLKSTISPGTTEYFQKKFPNHKFLFNPEFLTESKAWLDFVKPFSQIVGFTEASLDVARLVISILPRAPFMSPGGTDAYNQTRITATEAEIIKYAANIHHARKINWANALAKVCEKLGADYENVRKGMGADYRIGDSHLNVAHGGYRGFGGYCFPKDLSALKTFAKSQGLHDVYDLLMADWTFNEKLLKEQGLTIDDVSRHNGEAGPKDNRSSLADS